MQINYLASHLQKASKLPNPFVFLGSFLKHVTANQLHFSLVNLFNTEYYRTVFLSDVYIGYIFPLQLALIIDLSKIIHHLAISYPALIILVPNDLQMGSVMVDFVSLLL